MWLHDVRDTRAPGPTRFQLRMMRLGVQCKWVYAVYPKSWFVGLGRMRKFVDHGHTDRNIIIPTDMGDSSYFLPFESSSAFAAPAATLSPTVCAAINDPSPSATLPSA